MTIPDTVGLIDDHRHDKIERTIVLEINAYGYVILVTVTFGGTDQEVVVEACTTYPLPARAALRTLSILCNVHRQAIDTPVDFDVTSGCIVSRRRTSADDVRARRDELDYVISRVVGRLVVAVRQADLILDGRRDELHDERDLLNGDPTLKHFKAFDLAPQAANRRQS